MQREVDASGNTYLTVAELIQQEAERRAGAESPHSPHIAMPISRATVEKTSFRSWCAATSVHVHRNCGQARVLLRVT